MNQDTTNIHIKMTSYICKNSKKKNYEQNYIAFSY